MPHLRALAIPLTAVLALAATAAPVAAQAANPSRPPFREAKADWHDKELALSYGWGGPASMDFGLLSPLSFGVGVDHVMQPTSWIYRTTLKLVDEEATGLGIALNVGATNIKPLIAGSPDAASVWGWQAGLMTTLMTESGLTFRLGLQAYDTDTGAGGGQSVLITPEIAYRLGILEVTLIPQWPFTDMKAEWVGARVRF